MSLLVALLCGVALLGVARGQDQCPQLKAAALTSDVPSCIAYTNCTGLYCTNSNLNWTVSLTVQQCTDPVVMDVSVMTANGMRVAFMFTEQGMQQQGDVTVHLNRNRNASHIFVEAHSGTSDTLIPSVYVPLNPGVCMCQSVKSIAASSPSQVNCSKNTNCTGVVCDAIVATIIHLKIKGDIKPCTAPPSFIISIDGPNEQSIFKRSFTHSELANISSPSLNFLGLHPRLNVTLDEAEYSEIVQVDVLFSTSTITLIPRQQIILDKSHCLPTAPPSGSPITSATCTKLEEVAKSTSFVFTCGVENGCAGLTCRGYNHRLDLTILPCAVPPGVNVMLFNSSNALIYNTNVTNDTTIPVAPGIGVRIQVRESNDGIRMKADLSPINTPIIPYTDIPLNRCQCTNIVCNNISTPSPSQAPPTRITSPPPSTPQPSPQTGVQLLTEVLAISIPLVVIMALAIGIVITIVVIVVVRRQLRRRPQFTFQQMSNIVAEDDKDDD